MFVQFVCFLRASIFFVINTIVCADKPNEVGSTKQDRPDAGVPINMINHMQGFH